MADPAQDKDFLVASPSDQHAYLMQTDQGYAKASGEDQSAYLAHIQSTAAPVAPIPQPGALNPGMAPGLAMHPPSKFYENIRERESPDQIAQRQQGARTSGKVVEGTLAAATAALPVVGAIEAPLATAVGLGTGYLGSRVGGPVGAGLGGMVGAPFGARSQGAEIGRTLGEYGGGLVGGGLGVAGMESDLGRGLLRGSLSKISSPDIAGRIFPFSASEQIANTPSMGETIDKIPAWGMTPQNEQIAKLKPWGAEPVPAVPISQGPNYETIAKINATKAGIRSGAREATGVLGRVGESVDDSGDSQDLISRMKKIAIPGEEPSAADLKRAGDFTQVPLSRLQTLARFGDKLAQNELNRRLKQ